MKKTLLVCMVLLTLIAFVPFVEVLITWECAEHRSMEQYGMHIAEWNVLPSGDEYTIDFHEIYMLKLVALAWLSLIVCLLFFESRKVI